MKPLA